MPPRIRQSLSNPLREVSRPSSLNLRATSRPFTCSSCRTQRDQQQRPASNRPNSEPEYTTHSSAVPQRRLPRWAATPERMTAPVSMHKLSPQNRYNVNEDPARLDKAYRDVFGPGGEELVSEDVKWLAVTHKSFDQGRRGYNDRLAYLGKRLVDLQTSLAILAQPIGGVDGGSSSSMVPEDVVGKKDGFGRLPFRHPAMDILPKLAGPERAKFTRQAHVAELANEFGLAGVVRWKPRDATMIKNSGIEFILAQALYAMIGALALEKGGDAAVKAVRARILPRLGLMV